MPALPSDVAVSHEKSYGHEILKEILKEKSPKNNV